jgi:2-iminobutanoate/2-iminopropanoate deaminase
MDFVLTENAPPPGGHYSQAVKANGFVFLAGQLPLAADGGPMPDTIEGQARQALANVAAILQAAGSALDRVVSVTVYVSDISHWPAVNAIYAETFGDHRPARTIAVSPQLHFGAFIELQVVALG